MRYLFIFMIAICVCLQVSAQGPKTGKKSAKAPASAATPAKRVTVNFATSPSATEAVVNFGKKTLGVVPFSHTFDYDSGPVDVTFRAPGYYPVNTRVFTTKSYLVKVRMTPLDSGQDLLGYKEKLPDDAGVPPEGQPGDSTPNTH